MALLPTVITNFNSQNQHVSRNPRIFLFDIAQPDGQTTSDTTLDTLMVMPQGTIMTQVWVYTVVQNTGGVTTFGLRAAGQLIISTFVSTTEGQQTRNIGSGGIDPFVHTSGLAIDTDLTLGTTQATATATVGAKVRIAVTMMRVVHP